MAKVLLACSLNCDRVFELDVELRAGMRADIRSCDRRVGGAGANVGSALAAAGHQVDLACALGDDETGDWLCAEASALHIGLGALQRYSGVTPEVFILRQLGGERTILFVDRRAPYRPPPELAAEAGDVLFVNSASAAVAELMRACLDDRWVIAQMPQRPLDWPAHVLITSADDADAAALHDPFAAGLAMAGAALRYVVVTRGADGASAYGRGQRWDVPACPVEQVVDATGAGDVFAAGLIDALVTGRDIAAALAQAARWAALAVASDSSVAPPALRRYLSGN